VYYPGVAGSAAAATRVLGAGDHLDLGVFTLPRTVAFTQVHGVVTGPDGAPAAGAKVYLKLAGEEGSTLSEPARSRSDGTFLLSAALGAEYQVFAEQSVDEDGRRRLLTSEPETFTAASGLSAVTLRLRSPF
jgi:hypothetical protein